MGDMISMFLVAVDLCNTYQVRLCQDTQSAMTVRISLFCKSEDFLSSDVDVGRNHNQHHRAGVVHVAANHRLDHRCVGQSGHALGCSSEDARDIDHREVLLLRSGHFNLEHILREGGLAFTIFTGVGQAHELVDVLHSLGERDGLEDSIADALPGAQLIGIGLGGTLVRDDGDSGADRLCTTEGDLGCETSTQSGVSGKGQLGDALKNGRLATV
jgi:hypothetical protein